MFESVEESVVRRPGALGARKSACIPQASRRHVRASVARALLLATLLATPLAASLSSSAAAQLRLSEPSPVLEAGAAAEDLSAEETATLDAALAEIQAHADGRRSSALTDLEHRARIVRHYAPPTRSDSGLIPAVLRRIVATRAAHWLERGTAYGPAANAYAHAISFGESTPAVWRGLARAQLRDAELDAAEGAFLAALDLAQREQARHQEARTLAELGEFYLYVDRPIEAVTALEWASEMEPGELRWQALLARALHERDPRFVPAPTAHVALWPASASAPWLASLETRLEGWVQVAPEPVRRVLAFATKPSGRRIGGAVALLLVGLLVVRRLTRGSGQLVVAIEFPTELRGTFTVRVASRPGQSKRTPRAERASGPTAQASSRTAHHMVSRETLFTGLRPRVYYVCVEGVLQDPVSGEVLLDPFEEQAIQIARNATMRLEFDLSPQDSPVDVKVMWDKRPADDAGVTARGMPQTLRYTRGGATRMRLPRGKHTIVVGAGDRVTECPVDVQTFQPTEVLVDLAVSEGTVFKGCPPAVAPYLHGDMNAAAQALKRDGHGKVAHLLLARLHAEQGHKDRAAENFEAAGRPLEAAALLDELGHFARAAVLFREGGDDRRAAEMHREAGEWQQAGEAFASVQEWDDAVICFRESGDVSRWIAVLEHKGDFFQAADVASEHEEKGRAIRLLQQVGMSDPRYNEACRRLSGAFEAEGHTDLAAAKLKECIEADPDVTQPDLRFHLAELFDGSGQLSQALEVLEALRDSHPTYPNVASRIEGVRKKQSELSLQSARTGMQTAPLAQTPTAFLEGNRYEILSEIGRGGMGIVYKAHDKRLDREVALKRLPDNLKDHPKAIQLFLREAQSAARLNHRNIVTVYDTDQEGGNFFITMELLTGFPLNVIRKKKGKLSTRDVARVGAQVANGLAYAHSNRVIHRDIKTANLFFTTDKVVKIMDFGLAKMLEEVRRGGATVIGGTPFYMAPEQGLGGAVDHRADLYALGVTLFELATGRVPFSEGDVAYAHRHTPPPDPREFAAEIPAELAELILAMLAKEPEARTASADEVVEALRPLTTG